MNNSKNTEMNAQALAWANFNKYNWDHHMQISKPVYEEVLNNYPRTSTKKAMDDYSLKLVNTQNLRVTKPSDAEALKKWQSAYDAANITDELMQNDFKEKLKDSLPDRIAQVNLVNGIKGCYDSYPDLAPFLVPGAKPLQKEKKELLTEEINGIRWTYILNNEAAEIISAEGVKDVLEIPENLGEYKVSSIGSHAFEDFDAVTQIVLPSNLKTIGITSFSGCSNIKSLVIPASVEIIFASAFCGCRKLENLIFEKMNGKCNIKEIGIGAFYNCVSLTNVEIPQTVEKICDGAFAYCRKLEKFTVEDGNKNYKTIDGALYNKNASVIVACPSSRKTFRIAESAEKIGWWAFAGCNDLKNVELPESLTEIGDHAFFDCFALKNISIPSGVKTIGESAFSDCHSLEETVVLPEGLTRLGDSAFWHCTELTHMEIPDGITTLEGNVFELCTKLSSVRFPKNLTAIAKTAFVFCGSLKNLEIPEGVTSIGKAAFEFCTGLESISLPATLTGIKIRAFANCSKLKSITVSQDNPKFSSEDGILYSKDGKILYAYPDGIASGIVKIKEGVEVLSEGCFKGNEKITGIELPSSVKEIGLSAFWRCKNLSNVKFGSGLEILGNDVFMDCTSLEKIELPSGLKKICDWTFWNCTSLKTLSIPASLEHIGLGSFLHCDSLESIDVDKENKAFVSADGCVYTKDFEKLIVCPAGKTKLDVNCNTKQIGRYAALGCKKLENISLPECLESIDDWAFDGCEKIKEICIPDSVKSIGDFEFYDCKELSSVKLPADEKRLGVCMFENTALAEYPVPAGIECIERYAFLDCKQLIKLIIPETVKNVGRGAFYGCNKDLCIE